MIATRFAGDRSKNRPNNMEPESDCAVKRSAERDSFIRLSATLIDVVQMVYHVH